ncbi:unnamed protein product [Clavelina lepadiformis]|uniref:Activating signal cointegrator 1 complex subunit 3 n=1 Tax=Clavelina lepadiformis TaxID=159417 RepID=A0ABP0GHM0_CLALP
MTSEQKDLEVCISNYRAVFDYFLTPLSLLEFMPTLRDEARKEIQYFHDQPRKQVDIFLKELLECEERGIYQSFLDALNRSEDQRWIHDFMTGKLNDELTVKFIYHIENAEAFKKLFDIIQPQLNVIDARTLITVLRPWLSEGEKDDLNEKCNRLGSTYALPWIIYFILRKKPTWIKELYNHAEEANYSNEVEGTLAKALAQYFIFDENEKNVAEEKTQSSELPSTSAAYFDLHSGVNTKVNEAETSSSNELHTKLHHVENSSHDDPDDKDNETLVNSEQNIDTEKVDDGDTCTEIKEPCDPYQSYELRGYQHELVKLARQGKNVIICAPPGAGKTLVAANIIQNYYETSCRDDETKRNVLFFTPGIALAQQQHDRFKEYLPSKYMTDYRCGYGESTSLLGVKDFDVVVLTPQILLNELNSKDEHKSVYKIDEFGLLIYDECHHCIGSHPFNKVMRKYFGLEKDSDQLPQIIGLTATLGIGKAKTKDAALLEMKQLCANLNAVAGVVTVCDSQNKKEMEKHIANPDENHLPVNMKRDDPFFKEIITLMRNIEQVLKNLKEPIPQAPDYSQNDFDRQRFKQWCVETKKSLALTESPLSRNARSCVEYLEVCGEALDLYYVCRAEAALKLFESVAESQKQDTSTEISLYKYHTDAMNKLKKLCNDPRCANPNLAKIKNCILEKFAEVPDSRIMLMTQMKIYVYALKDWMNDDDKLEAYQPEVFTGLRTSAGVKGLSIKKQQAIMKSFRSGRHKILISTPHAAGEGIDVADCNLVINYNFLRNESLTLQIKGRVRKRGGEMVHISSDRVARRDQLNVHRTQLMNECTDILVDFIQSDQMAYRKELEGLNKLDMRRFHLEVLKKLKESQELEKVKQSNEEFLLQCAKCKGFVCSSHDLRLVENAHRINIMPEFKEKYEIMEHPRKDKRQMGQDWKKINKVICKNCNLDWGIEALYKGVFVLPLIKIEGFRITKKSTGSPFVTRKWKNAPFVPQDINLDVVLNQLCDDE